MYMKFVSWNVAGFRSCLKKGFADFFGEVNADVVCLQETKLTEKELTFRPEGYDIYLYPANKKGYAGTAVYTRVKPLSVTYGLGIPEHDEEGRVITLEFEKYYLINFYVPNSKRGLLRLDYRMQWEDVVYEYLHRLEKKKPIIFCGDLNVCHKEIDIANPKANLRNAGFTIEERDKFSRLLDSGFIDTYRYMHPDEVIYTWWSYIGNVRARNIGWRLDYFVISASLLPDMVETAIYTNVMGSDHCPIGLTMK